MRYHHRYISLTLALFLPTFGMAAIHQDQQTDSSSQSETISEDVIRNILKDMKSFQKNLNELLSIPPLKDEKGKPLNSEEIHLLMKDVKEIKHKVNNLEDAMIALTNSLGRVSDGKKDIITKDTDPDKTKAQLINGSQIVGMKLTNELMKLRQQIEILNNHIARLSVIPPVG